MAPQESDLTAGHFEKKKRYSKLSLKRRMRFDPQDEEIEPKRSKMMNGHNVTSSSTGSGLNSQGSNKFESGRFSSASASSTSTSNLGGSGAKSVSSCSNSIASLCNLGNTCFLNSVLYTLRFTPGFLHNLHHLVSDLGLPNQVERSSSKQDKKKNAALAEKKATESNSDQAETERIHDVIEQLHDLFRNMSSSDDHLLDSSHSGSSSNVSKEPIAPSNFLHAVGKMNSMFEGNQQQDAHELLIALLTMLRDIKLPPPGSILNSSSEPAADEMELKSSKKKSKKSSLLTSNGHGNGLKKMEIVEENNPPPPPEMAPNSTADNNEESSDSSSSSFNFVRENFVGKTVFRTKCLECETSTYRSDKFINIDIPLNFDDNDLSENGFEDNSRQQLSVADLFLKQIMASETLRENNKYLCVECSRLNEAQRSVQYELLPKVLVLQLKRFTAATNKSAFMSKINDFIPTPFTMNCFCTQCLPPDAPLMEFNNHPRPPKHHYRLFSVIMHLGATLASGHYIAYVRASVDLSLDYSRCPKANQMPVHQPSDSYLKSGGSHQKMSSLNGSGNHGGGQKTRGIMKYFSRSDKEKNNINGLHNLNLNGSGNVDTTDSTAASSAAGVSSQPSHCRSANCCGMQRVLRQLNRNSSTAAKSQESLNNGYNSETDSISNNVEDVWLECDDENISLISRRQFEDELNSKQSATTPYLLFYERV